MPKVGILFKWLAVSVLIVMNWYCCLTDGTCLYPGHESNELVSFSKIRTTNTYPVQTKATYWCEVDQRSKIIKEAECHENGSWTFTQLNNVNCSLETSIRCKRPVIERSSYSNSFIFEGNCFTLYKGIHKSTLKNMKSTCDDIGKYLPNSDTLNTLKERMCNMSLFDGETQIPGKIYLAGRTENKVSPITVDEAAAIKTGTNISSSLPKCRYLNCSSQDAFVVNDCHDFTYWICKHNISSCGRPSQEMYSIMNTTGNYVTNTATYICIPGYKTKDLLTRTCGKDGLWSGQPPSCKSSMMTESNFSKDPSTESNENPSNSLSLKPGEGELLKVIIGSIAGVTLFIIGLIWLVVAVLLWHHKRKEFR